MEPLNFCRQMRTQFVATLKNHDIAPVSRKLLSHCVDLAACSQKFILPQDGRLLDDPEYRGLDESVPLRLPYQFIALEYTRSKHIGDVPEGEEEFRKALVFARERDDCIVITPVIFSHRHNMWAPVPEVAISKTGYLDRSLRDQGHVPLRVHYSHMLTKMRISFGNIQCEVGAVVSFLNALSCSNVGIERIGKPRAKKLPAAALPFDEYHVLTIKSKGSSVDLGGSHRSPREHLRRGHIRRLSDGRRLWINATVVNAGVGGVITKDYALT